MKTYKEMTDSVFSKAQNQIARRKRRVTSFTLVCACLCCIILVVTLFGDIGTPDMPNGDVSMEEAVTNQATEPFGETNGSETESPKLIFLCADSNNASPQIMEQKIMIPYKAELRVLKTAGMNKEEKHQACEKENAYVSEMWGDLVDESGFGRYTLDNVMVTTVSVGALGIKVNDWDSIARICASVTENGTLLSFPRVDGSKTSAYTFKEDEQLLMEIDGKHLKECLAENGRDFLGLFWNISPWSVTKLDKDPDMDLSQFSDRITITIEYTDGGIETATILMLVDGNGKISAMLEGSEITA